MIWILLIMGAVVLMSSKSVTPPARSATSDNVVNTTLYKKATATSIPKSSDQSGYAQNVIVTRVPPPGYSGPVNGPFTWAGIGPPPNCYDIVLGIPVD